MHRWGHVGAALLAYAPAGAAATAVGDPALAVLGAVVAVAVSTLPDADEFLPVEHRGPSHTVWFVAGCALVAFGIGAAAGRLVGRPTALPTVAAAAVGLSLTSHLLADVITPMGIRPFHPLSSWHHSLGLTPARNRRANAAFLAAGIVSLALSQAVVLL
jgi:inner membrane protein